jgi:hypothetical protein
MSFQVIEPGIITLGAGPVLWWPRERQVETMGVPIEISGELAETAEATAAARSRSVAEQIEHWARSPAHLGRPSRACYRDRRGL